MSNYYELKKLRNQMRDLGQNQDLDNETKYRDIYNLCNEIDCVCPDLNLSEYFYNQEFVTEDDVLEYLIPQNSDSLERLRCFLNTTYDDTIYRIDGYGNLDNLSSSYLSDLCYDLVNEIDKELGQDEEM